MSKFGIKISRPGYDVRKATDVNLVFSSEFNTFKVFRVIHFDYDGARDPSNIESIAHGLTYAPTFLALSEDASTAGNWSYAISGYFGGGISQVFVDDTNVYYNQNEACYVILFIDPLDGE